MHLRFCACTYPSDVRRTRLKLWTLRSACFCCHAAAPAHTTPIREHRAPRKRPPTLSPNLSSANTCFTRHPRIGTRTRVARHNLCTAGTHALHRSGTCPHIAPAYSLNPSIWLLTNTYAKNMHTRHHFSKTFKTPLLLMSFLTHLAEHYPFWGCKLWNPNSDDVRFDWMRNHLAC